MNCEWFSYNQLLKTSAKCNSTVATEATATEIWRLLVWLMSHDVSHDMSHDILNEMSRDMSHYVSHYVSHDMSCNMSHDMSWDMSHYMSCDMLPSINVRMFIVSIYVVTM